MVNSSEGFDFMIINFSFIVDLLMVVELFSFTVSFLHHHEIVKKNDDLA